MPKTKISEYSATANSNTDVGGINIDEGCAPSGINDAIRTMMAQLKNFQTGTGSDSFNGPVGSTTASTGAFTTLTASGNVTLGDASTDTLNVGNGGIVKDASGNVGLGTAAGNAKLSVETGSTYAAIFGTSSTSAGTTRISFGNYLSGAGGGAGSAAIGGVHNHGSSSLSSLAFYTHNGTSLGEVGRFDSAGNLGLGVTPQSWLSTSRVLQLGSGGAVEARSNYEPYLSITSNAYLNTAGTYKYIATAEAARYLQDAGTHKFFIAPSGSAGADITTFTQAMTLNASWNLGVGATFIWRRRWLDAWYNIGWKIFPCIFFVLRK
jgi:hypothetical protein